MASPSSLDWWITNSRGRLLPAFCPLPLQCAAPCSAIEEKSRAEWARGAACIAVCGSDCAGFARTHVLQALPLQHQQLSASACCRTAPTPLTPAAHAQPGPFPTRLKEIGEGEREGKRTLPAPTPPPPPTPSLTPSLLTHLLPPPPTPTPSLTPSLTHQYELHLGAQQLVKGGQLTEAANKLGQQGATCRCAPLCVI